MRLKHIFPALLLMSAMQAFSQTDQGFKTLPSGVKYKIHGNSDTAKIKVNDVVTFNIIQKTDKDSLLFSSFQAGKPATVQVQQARDAVDMMSLFPLLAARDSASFKIPTDSIFKGHETERPPFFPKGGYLSLEMKIEKVQSIDEAMADYQKEMDRLKGEEAAVLAKYISSHSLKPLTTASGLKYIITRPSTKSKPVVGDTVYVNYIGSTLEGKVFDSSIEAEAKKAGLEQPGRTYEPISFVLGEGRVIKGWDEGLALLNEGSKATFLIPSDLAYGPEGASEDIKPFSTLRFDLELVKVKKPKQAGTAPAKPAPAVKKSTSTTGAKKPAPTVKKSTTPAAKPKSSPK